MKKHVLTGGPSSGKTTLINILASRGYTTVPEAALAVIKEEKAQGNDPFRDVAALQQKIAERQIVLEKEAVGEIVFLDRSVIDGYAYCLLGGGVPIPPEILAIGQKEKYEKVFLLQPTGAEKNRSAESQHHRNFDQIQENLKKAYQKFGYTLVEVPALSPEERVNFILKQVGLSSL